MVLECRHYKIFFNLTNKLSFTGKVRSALPHGAASPPFFPFFNVVYDLFSLEGLFSLNFTILFQSLLATPYLMTCSFVFSSFVMVCRGSDPPFRMIPPLFGNHPLYRKVLTPSQITLGIYLRNPVKCK